MDLSLRFVTTRFLPFTPGTHLGMRRWNSAGFWYWSYIEHEEQPVSEKTYYDEI